jgi:hypothetical protein
MQEMVDLSQKPISYSVYASADGEVSLFLLAVGEGSFSG